MQREHRQLHRERREEPEEDELDWHACPGDLHGAEYGVVERALREAERQNRGEHEARPRQRIEQELHRRVFLAARPPDGDEQEHRHELQLPEQEEQHQIERREHAEDARLEDEQPREVLPGPQVDLPRDEHRQERQQAGEHEHDNADAVDGEQILHVEVAYVDPVGVLAPLEAAVVAVEHHEQRDCRHEHDECRDGGDLARTHAVVLGHKHDRECAEEREEDDQRQHAMDSRS